MKIKKGDNVVVITGKDKGKTGVIGRALPKSKQVIIEGVNLKKRHQKARKQGSKGQILDKAMPIHISNVQIVDPKKGGGTRIKIERESGKRVRVAKKSGATIAK
ncbi:MAG: 50S ribosomal protein L24 [bacterium]|nr:50S ribosomal protein L24 [bacterium]